MLIRAIRDEDLDAARQLLLESGWGHRGDDMLHFGELVARSQIALVAVDGTAVVGFVRALTDGLANGYLSMLAVTEARRGQGIGSALVRACMGDNPRMTWVLRTGRPGLQGFYERLGFQVSSVAMERPRRPSGGA